VRRHAVWLVTVPLALCGAELGHALGNALLGSPEGPRGELLDGAGPGAELVPVLAAGVLATVVLGLAVRAGTARRHQRLTPSPGWFALLGPLVFVLQEQVERALHGGLPFAALAEPGLAAGLALQLPFAAAGYLVARTLLRLGDAIGNRLRRAPWLRPRRPESEARRAPANLWPRSRRPTAARLGRAPPRVTVAAA